MTSLPRTVMVVALVALGALTSCGDKSNTKVAEESKPGDQLFHEWMWSDERRVERTGKPYTPEQKKFFHTCTKVKFAMSEQEIDAIMSAYPSHRLKIPDLTEKEGKYIKVYDEKPGANESDYYLSVTFDDTHHLVSAYVSEYFK